MELKVSYDDDGNEYLDRVEFAKSIIDTIDDYLGDNKLIVKRIQQNSIVVSDEGQDYDLNINDEMELELKLLVYVLTSATHYITPKILFHLAIDELDNFMITGLSLMDFSGIMVSSEDTDFDYSVELGSRYLINLFQQKGLVSLKLNNDSKPKKILLIPSVKNENEEDHCYNDFIQKLEQNELLFLDDNYLDKSESSLSKPTASSVSADKKNKARRNKRIKMNRAKDPAAYRKRSQAARLRWRKYKQKYLKGMKKFHMSARGKRINKNRGQKLSLSSKS